MQKQNHSSQSTAPAGSGSGDGHEAKADEGGGGALEQAKSVAGQVRETASHIADVAKAQAAARATAQKERAAEGLGEVAEALHHTSERVRHADQEVAAHWIDQAAGQLDRMSEYLKNRDVGQLVNEVESFARRDPALFYGGALVLGFVGARFLKSSAHHAAAGERSDGYETPRALPAPPRREADGARVETRREPSTDDARAPVSAGPLVASRPEVTPLTPQPSIGPGAPRDGGPALAGADKGGPSGS